MAASLLQAGDPIKLTVTKVPSGYGPVTLKVTPQTPRLLLCDSMSDMPDLAGQAEFSCKVRRSARLWWSSFASTRCESRC